MLGSSPDWSTPASAGALMVASTVWADEATPTIGSAGIITSGGRAEVSLSTESRSVATRASYTVSTRSNSSAGSSGEQDAGSGAAGSS